MPQNVNPGNQVNANQPNNQAYNQANQNQVNQNQGNQNYNAPINQGGNRGGNNPNQGNNGGNNKRNQNDPNRNPRNNQVGNRRRDGIDSLPKTLRYNGTENWNAFKQKFNRYAAVKAWNQEECKDYLCFSLEGKALEFFTTILQRDEDLTYDDLVQKMDKRFGVREIPETAQTKLATMKQRFDETIEDWADRVLQLATKAYQNLPDEFMYKQAVKRICLGCCDREAGQYAANLSLTTIEDTIDKIKGYQHNHQAIYDKNKREVKEVRCEVDESFSDSDQSVKICQTRSNFQKKSEPSKEETSKLDLRLSSLENQLGSLMMEIKAMNRRIQVRSRSNSPNRRRSRSPTPKDICFHCGGQGHFRNNCPKLDKDNKSAKKEVTFADHLKVKGSREEA